MSHSGSISDSEEESDGGFASSKGKTRAGLKKILLDACRKGKLSVVREIVKVIKVPLKECVAEDDPHKDTLLHIAAYHGHKKIVKYLVEKKHFRVDSRNYYKNTPLHRAAKQGHLEVVKYLVEEKNSNPVSECHWKLTPLHSACKHGKINVVKFLLSIPKVIVNYCKVDKFYQKTPLQLAVEYGTLEVVRYIMENYRVTYSSSDKKYSLLHLAAYGGKLEIVKYLIQEQGTKDEDRKTPLHSACASGQLEVVKFLTSRVDISFHKKSTHPSPLDVAAKYGQLDVVKYLIEEKKCQVEHSPDDHQNSALHYAASQGQFKVFKYLIEVAKCNPQCRGNKGRTPLHLACSNGQTKIVDYLIHVENVKILSKDDMDTTPLHLAAEHGHKHIAKHLVQCLEHLTLTKNKAGKTALDYARAKDHSSVAHYLKAVHKNSDGLQHINFERLKKHSILSCRPTGVKLGKGAFSKVVELKERDGTLLAGKIFKIDTEVTQNLINRLINEIEIMFKLQHPNIVTYKGVCFQADAKLPLLVMEKMETSFHDYLLKPGNSGLPVERKVSFLLDTARGLEYLHNSRTPAIIHRDLTAKNVLLDSQLRAKIADFGNSRIMELHSDMSPGSMTAAPGTLAYMPPEAFGENAHYGPSLDVFSFGHLSLFTVIQSPVHLLLPPNHTDSVTGEQHARSEVERREEFMGKARELLSEDHPLLDLITQCLSNLPKDRPAAPDLVKRLQEMKTTAGTGEEMVQPFIYEIPSSPVKYGDSGIGSTSVKPDSVTKRSWMSPTSATNTQVFPVIRGADIVAWTTVEIPPDQPLDFHWEGHGFKVHIPARAIRRERGRVALCIQASLSGDYQLPDDGVLVSGVYWLSLHPHVEKFDKKVTISLQHCASDDDSSISFVAAKCTQETLPYTFNPLLPGGSFDVFREGTILVDQFSALTIAAHHNPISDYAICSYYIPKHINITDIHITVTPDHDLQLQVVRQKYQGYEEGPNTTVCIKDEKISLHIPPDTAGGTEMSWELIPLVQPLTLEKKRLDCFEKGKLIPHFPLELKLKSLNDPQPFSQKICFLTGIEPSISITLTRNLFSESRGTGPGGEAHSVYPRPPTSTLTTDDLFDVKTELLSVVARWKHIGLALRLNPSELKKIERENRDNLEDCLNEALTLWLNKAYNTERFGEPSWELLARAVAHPAGGNNPALSEEMSHKTSPQRSAKRKRSPSLPATSEPKRSPSQSSTKRKRLPSNSTAPEPKKRRVSKRKSGQYSSRDQDEEGPS